jgi:hypothetical protein
MCSYRYKPRSLAKRLENSTEMEDQVCHIVREHLASYIHRPFGKADWVPYPQ